MLYKPSPLTGEGLDGGEINATVTLSEPKQSILFLDKNGLLLTANRRSRNDPRGGLRCEAAGSCQ